MMRPTILRVVDDIYHVDGVTDGREWAAFGDIVEVRRPAGGSLSAALNEAARQVVGPGWVMMVEEGELPVGSPEALDDELARAVEHLVSDRHQLALASIMIGPDWLFGTAHPRAWYVPAGSSFCDEFYFDFEIDPVVLSRRPLHDLSLIAFTQHLFCVRRDVSIRSLQSLARREAVRATLDPRLWTIPERQHYEACVLQPATPVLSLCVIARRVDESLKRMLASVRGHVSEVCILFTAEQHDEAEVRAALADVVRVALKLGWWKDPDEFALPSGERCIANFDHARQVSFELATGLWRMFLDSDDTLEWSAPSQVEPPPLWELCVTKWRDDRSIGFPYFYAASGEGDIQMIAQPRNCIWRWTEDDKPIWRWHRPLHERVIPTEWNKGTRHKDYRLPGDVFIIRHHGANDATEHQARNYTISQSALERRNDLQDDDRAALLFVMAIIEYATKKPGGLERLRACIALAPNDSYGFLAAIHAAEALVLENRGAEVPELLLPVIDRRPGDLALCLAMARAYQSFGQTHLALKWFAEAYKPRPENPAEYRSLPLDEQVKGRLEATALAVDLDRLDYALMFLEGAAPEIQARQDFQDAFGEVHRQRGDLAAAAAVRTLTHYLLSLDCVDYAEQVIQSLPPQLVEQQQVVASARGVELRMRHIRCPEDYLACYNVCNEADMVIKAKAHHKAILKRIIEHNPATFIDVGCNTGWLLLSVAKALPECRCVGLDISAARIDEARRRCAIEGFGDRVALKVIASDAAEEMLELAGSVFPHPRVVLVSEVIEHLGDPERTLSLWAAVADRLLVTCPDVEAYWNLWKHARRLDMPPSVCEKTARAEGFEHIRCYDAHRLARELHGVGLEVERIERVNIARSAGEEPGKQNDRSLLFADAGFAPEPTPRRARVDIYAQGWIPWGPRAHLEGSGSSRMVGGSEQAVIHLAPELVKLGYEVHVYADPMDRREYDRGVWWHHLGEFQPSEKRDAVIVWRRPEHLLRLHSEAAGRWPVMIWCHDVPNVRQGHEYNVADKVIVLSDYQARLYHELVGVPNEKLVTLQNGVDAAAVAAASRRELDEVAGAARDLHAVFYGSSGDRGLLHLLRMWPSVREAVPDARLFATYRTDLMRWPTNPPTWFAIADEIERLGATLPGVTFYPGLPHDEYLATAARCGVWAYPSNFEEISCIVAMEMQALGLEPVATDLAALEETVLEGPFVRWSTVSEELTAGGAERRDGTLWVPDGCFSKTFRDVLVGALLSPMPPEDRLKLSEAALARYSWTRTARLFAEAIEANDGYESGEDPSR